MAIALLGGYAADAMGALKPYRRSVDAVRQNFYGNVFQGGTFSR
ncbi:hypothetical protein [Devosia lacusdianchii]|nr:hypothetical protein [Devosia sp. JXJ CY 41]